MTMECGLSAVVSSPALIQHGGSSSSSDLLRSHQDAETHHIVSNTRHMTSAARPSRTSLTRSHSDVSRDRLMSASRGAVTVDNRRLSLDTHQLPQQHQYQHHAAPVRMFPLSFQYSCVVVFIIFLSVYDSFPSNPVGFQAHVNTAYHIWSGNRS